MSAPAMVDAHHHFWTAEAAAGQSWRGAAHAAIAGAYLPAALAPALTSVNVRHTVLMQAADQPQENRDLAGYAAAAPFVAGVVGWLPLPDPDRAAAELASLRALPMPLCGVRCLVGADPLDWATTPAALGLFRTLAGLGLCWDVVPLTSGQVAAVCAVADAVPALRIVVDHLARPPADTGAAAPWYHAIDSLAARPNIAIKLSVGVDLLTRWPAWEPATLRPYLAYALERFGAGRCMLASNWPVSLLRVDYETGWRDLRDLVAHLAPTERAQVAGGTATAWYQLSIAEGGTGGERDSSGGHPPGPGR